MVSFPLFAVALLAGAFQAAVAPTITTKPSLITKTVKLTCTVTKCIDKVNSCKKKYGGCYESCPGSPEPTFLPVWIMLIIVGRLMVDVSIIAAA